VYLESGICEWLDVLLVLDYIDVVIFDIKLVKGGWFVGLVAKVVGKFVCCHCFGCFVVIEDFYVVGIEGLFFDGEFECVQEWGVQFAVILSIRV